MVGPTREAPSAPELNFSGCRTTDDYFRKASNALFNKEFIDLCSQVGESSKDFNFSELMGRVFSALSENTACRITYIPGTTNEIKTIEEVVPPSIETMRPYFDGIQIPVSRNASVRFIEPLGVGQEGIAYKAEYLPSSEIVTVRLSWPFSKLDPEGFRHAMDVHSANFLHSELPNLVPQDRQCGATIPALKRQLFLIDPNSDHLVSSLQVKEFVEGVPLTTFTESQASNEVNGELKEADLNNCLKVLQMQTTLLLSLLHAKLSISDFGYHNILVSNSENGEVSGLHVVDIGTWRIEAEQDDSYLAIRAMQEAWEPLLKYVKTGPADGAKAALKHHLELLMKGKIPDFRIDSERLLNTELWEGRFRA